MRPKVSEKSFFLSPSGSFLSPNRIPPRYSIETYVKYVTFFLAEAERQIHQALQAANPQTTPNSQIRIEDDPTTASDQQFILVCDISDWRLYHAGYLSYIRQLVTIVQDHFPERLRIAYVLNAPSIFWMFWRVFQPLVQERTRAKLRWVNPKPARGQESSSSPPPSEDRDLLLIKEEIDLGMWPARYGGRLRDEEIRVPNVVGVADVEPTPYLQRG